MYLHPVIFGPGKKYMEAHSATAHGLDHKGNLQAVEDAHFANSTQNLNLRKAQQVPSRVQMDYVMPVSMIDETKTNMRPAGHTTAALDNHIRVQPGFNSSGWNVFR